MRCKACDAKLQEWEMVIREETQEFEELCLICRKASQLDDDIEDELDDAFLRTWLGIKEWPDD